MSYINKKDIENKITNENIIGDGKEAVSYKDGEIVIKIFKDNRQSPFKRISDEGLEKLSTLDLKSFNKPIDIIVDNIEVIGYTEKFLNIKDLDGEISKENLEDIKEDIKLLSNNGFKIEDLMYNYTFDKKLIFYDMTSYTYTNTTKKELLDFYYKKNIATINLFLVGLTKFDAYKHGSNSEFTKIFKSNEYISENMNDDEYYGDFISRKI